MATKKNNTYRLFKDISDVDISETDIWEYDPEVLNQLLIDHTMSAKVRADAADSTRFANIFWATRDYEDQKEDEADKAGYRYADQIMPDRIVGQNGRVVMPRVLKDKQLQDARVKDKAEVFTPSWVCNAQNNLIDQAWFGREEVFNREYLDEHGQHAWMPTEGKIEFPAGDKQKDWKKYVRENRMEITCGEGPYLVSRYDTTTGAYIPVDRRIGLLDRKLRVISENISDDDPKGWVAMAKEAYKHTYGYEWQGDNLLLAREALLYTFIEYYIEKFNKQRDDEGKVIAENVPDRRDIVNIARIISWNLWQMDGIKMVVPDTCHSEEVREQQLDLFSANEPKITIKECLGCKTSNPHKHNGVYCLIRDWSLKRAQAEKNGWKPQPGEDPKSSPWQKITFVSLLNGKQDDTEEEEDSSIEE